MTTEQPTCDLWCQNPIHDGAYVCAACTQQVREDLGRVRVVAGEAITTIALLANITLVDGGRRPDSDAEPEPKSAANALYPTTLPFDVDAVAAHEAAVGELTGWARHLAEQTGAQLPTVRLAPCVHETCAAARAKRRAMVGPACVGEPPEHPLEVVARWLQGQLDELRRREEAEEALEAISAACRQLVRVVDRDPDRWYVGKCGALTMDGPCGQDLRPVARAKVVRCRCGAEWDVKERKEQLLQRVDDQWFTAAQCAHVLTALGVPTNASTIRTWAARHRLMAHPEKNEHPLYRVGSVRELVLQRQVELQIRRWQVAVKEAEEAEKRRRREAAEPKEDTEQRGEMISA